MSRRARDDATLARGMEHGDEVIAEAAAAAATKIAAGCGDELMPRDTPGVFATPVTAARYATLAGRATADDMFSSDLTDEELAEIGAEAAREHGDASQIVPRQRSVGFGDVEEVTES